MTLVPLPAQPHGLPWPAPDWAEGPIPRGVDLAPLLDAAFDTEGPLSVTYAVVVIHRGRLVAERYGGVIEHWDRADEPVGPDTPLLSWSMAKSMLHAAVGVLVGEGRLHPDLPAPVPQWAAPTDPRRAITLQHLLEMRDGLDFVEDYVDARASDVIEMLFGAGKDDVAGFAADRPPAAAPGSRFNYSSGTSNIVAAVVGREVGPGESYAQFLRDRLFVPIGATSARPTLDAAGTWVASSYVYATARDFARFGYLYLRDGVWDGERVLPEGWVDHGRHPRSVDPEDGSLYGAHWWVVGDGHGSFWASGYEGQSILVCPALDLVVVRLGKTPRDRSPELCEWRAAVAAAFGAGDAILGT
jgi:CubicO group peptidase (beta-lactamase class C family)